MTVARMWVATVDEDRADEYERFAREVSLPMFKAEKGYQGALMLRNGAHCVVLTLWEDDRAAGAILTSKSYNRTVETILEKGFLRGKQSLELFSVHLADGQP